ncbi:MAG: hypothetical protein M0Z48_02450 [Nitrospiraceae bacterium]|nr:hypothetical protein [Nitrospiraceae bacterium]
MMEKSKMVSEQIKSDRPKKKKVEIQITERDEEMFVTLIPGGIRPVEIIKLLNSKFTLEALQKRISYLRYFKYLQSGYYMNRKTGHQFVLHALDELGADYLCQFHGYRRESIRNYLPATNQLIHYAGVTEEYRKVIRESSTWDFDLLVFDERWKKAETLAMDLREKAFADLYLKLMYNLADRKALAYYCIENDNETTPAMRFVRKLDYISMAIFVICRTQERIEALKRAINLYEEEVRKKREKKINEGKRVKERESLINRLYLGQLCDFMQHAGGGIHGTIWQKANNINVNIVRPDNKSVRLRKETK